MLFRSVKIRVGTSHPLADPNGYAYEHLIVWVSAGRSKPPSGHLLHHINEQRQDNRLDNLEKKSRGEHNNLHNTERGRNALGQLKKRAGSMLDGVEWNEFPEVSHGKD